ncbi:MAG: hypothetical protein Q4A62_01720 [Eikenella sp.]|nr:hypothetical protein [Eikenella sp.]
MKIGKRRANSWLWVYIAMFTTIAFILKDWTMVVPGLIFALLFGLEQDKPASDNRADQGSGHRSDS